MVIVRQEFVLVVVRHDLGINDMLKNCARYTCEGYRSIVGGAMLVSFLEHSNHITRQPNIRDTRVGMISGPVALLQSRLSSNCFDSIGVNSYVGLSW